MIFVGAGASGIVAQDAQQKFPLFRVPCQAPADHHQQFIAASLSVESTVVGALSHTAGTRSRFRSLGWRRMRELVSSRYRVRRNH
jgi:DNA-binding MurR/RpiR family transcriptional regulator